MLDESSLGLAPKITHEVYEKLKEINAAGSIKFHGSAHELGQEKLLCTMYIYFSA